MNDRLRVVLVALLVASGVFFAIGSAVERSKTHETAPTASETVGEVHSSESGGGSGTEGSTPTETKGGTENLFGINPESTGLVAVAVAVSLLLAGGVWLWERRSVLLAVLVFGVVFAALDGREAVHQAHEARGSLVVLAVALGLLHLAVSVVAGLRLRGRAPEVATT